MANQCDVTDSSLIHGANLLRRVGVNNEEGIPSSCGTDFFFPGESDKAVLKLVEMLDWKDDLVAKKALMAPASASLLEL